MDHYIIFLTFVGLVTFAMAWMPAFSRSLGISYSVIYVACGVLVYLLFPSMLPTPLPYVHPDVTIRLSELVVIISIMGTGLKIDRSFSIRNWSSPLKLISLAMVLCIAGAAWLGYSLLGLNLATAILLGAALAPTDPVLASDVQVGPPNEGLKSDTRFSLTAEAGLNDGVAFPFILLAIILNNTSPVNAPQALSSWLLVDVLYRIVVAIAIGLVIGRSSGHLVFKLSNRFDFLKTNDGFLAISMTLLVYGATELVKGYGFIAVFIAAITFRHYEKLHDYHEKLHSFTEQVERVMVAVLLILFGGALVTGLLDSLNWSMVGFCLLFLFVIRPLAAYISLIGSAIHIKEKLAISFFGIRGMGSIFYVGYALNKAAFMREKDIWAIVGFTILISVIIHGLTATSIMNYLRDNMKKEKIPD